VKTLKFEFSVFLLLLLAVLAPISRLIKYNGGYFVLSGVEYLISASIVAILVYVLTLFASFFLRKSVLLNFARLLLVVSVISVFFIPIDLDAIDGGDILDFKVRSESFILLAVTLTFLFLYTLFFNGRFNKQIKLMSSFSAVYVVVFFCYAAFGLGSFLGFTGENGDYKMPLSSKKNVFLISFDQVQGTAFRGLLESDEKLRKVFDNFTFYSDATSTYPNTNYSLASVLLGRRASKAAESYKFSMASDDSFLASVKKSGAKVYTSRYGASQKYTCLTCASDNKTFNTQKTYELLRHAINLSFGVDIGVLVDYLPVSTKNALLGDTSIYAWKNDIKDFEALVSNAYINSSQTSVYFMHFLATHQPFTYDENCQLMSDSLIDKHQNPDGALLQMRCIAKQMKRFFDVLKFHSVYKDSLIILYSDHGYEKNINDYARDPSYTTYFSEISGYVGDEGNIKPSGAYNPILFVKYPHENENKLAFNSAPVSLIDIAPTVCLELKCGKEDWQGFNLESLLDRDRVREFWLYLGGSDRRDADGTDKLHDGLDQYWEVRAFPGPANPNIAYAMGMDDGYLNPSLTINQKLVFDQGGQSDNYIDGGWSRAEKNHRWTVESSASVRFFLSDFSGPQLVIGLHASAFLPANKNSQTVHVMLNNNQGATWHMNKLDWYEAVIPQGLIDETGEVKVQFEIAEPTAPCDVSDSNDCRKLGFAARELVIAEYKNESSSESKREPIVQVPREPVPSIMLGQTIDFSTAGASQFYVKQGWSPQEDTHRWTEGGMARLQLPFEDAENEALRLKVFGNGYIPKSIGYQLVKVLINGEPVAEWQVSELAWHEALIPADVARTTGEPLQVDFLIDEPTAPCEMSDSQDCRKLGLAVRELVIERQ
jgi:hypothetical protein